MTDQNRRISASFGQDGRLIGYSAGNFGKNLLLSGVDVTLLFMLTDLLGMPPASISSLMMLVFAGDLLFDIGAGLLASWAQSIGVGYRRILLIGMAPCGAAFALLYSLPMLGVRQIGVLAATLLLFRAGYAVIDVPHNSLLARVAPDSHARGRASGYRLFFSSLAGLAIATVLTPSVEKAARFAMTDRLSLLGVGAGLLFCVAVSVAALSSREEVGASPAASRIALFPKPDHLLMGMLVIAFVTGFAMPMFGRMALYWATYGLSQPALASRILLAVTLGQFPGVLMWTYLVRFREKTSLLAMSNAIAAGGILLFAMAGRRPEWLMAAAALTGVGLAGVFMLPWGILADIIDFSEFRHRERRETASFALILVVIKASGAASVGLTGWLLSRLGYVPGIQQPTAVLIGMKAIAFGIPVLGSIASIATLTRLSIGHRAHARVLRVLGTRRRRTAQGSSGSIGSTRSDAREGRKVSSKGESRFSTVPG